MSKTIEEMLLDLQQNMRMTSDHNGVAENKRRIREVRDYIQERTKVLDALNRANQAMCPHPKEFRELVLISNTDGYHDCRLCGATDV